MKTSDKIGITFVLLLGIGLVTWGLWPRHKPVGDPSVWITTPEVKGEVDMAEKPANYQPAIPLPTKDNKYTDLGGGVHQISGKVTNTDTVTRSIMITITYYDRNNKPIEGGAASYTDIAAGTSIDYSVNTGRDVSGFKRFEVKANAF